MSIKILKIGETSPNVNFRIKTGATFQEVWSADLFKDKRVLVLGIPGPFWTDYPSSMLLGYEFHFAEFIQFGINEIYVTSTCDSYVMSAWLNHLNVKKIKPLPDGNSAWATKTGLLIDMSDTSMGLRSHRYAMILENNSLKKLFYEDFTHDPHTCFTETNAEKVLGFLKDNQKTWLTFSRRIDGSPEFKNS